MTEEVFYGVFMSVDISLYNTICNIHCHVNTCCVCPCSYPLSSCTITASYVSSASNVKYTLSERMTQGPEILSSDVGENGSNFRLSTNGHFDRRYHRLRETRHNDSDSGRVNVSVSDVLCFPCKAIAFLLCFAAMKRRTRILLLWMWLFAICLGAWLFLSLGVFGNQTLTASPTDMRKVPGISSSFCSDIDIQSTTNIDAFLFSTDPVIDQHKLVRYSLTKEANIHAKNYMYLSYYLLQGSKVETASCASSGIYFYVIKGQKNLDKWLKDSYCSDCYGTYQYIDEIYACNGVFNPLSTSIEISESDTYYILYANDYTETSAVAFEIVLDRAVYKTKDQRHSCKNSESCSFALKMSSSESVVFSLPTKAPYDTTITVTCNDRIWFYICILFLVPAAFGILVSVMLCHCCKPGNSSRETRQRRSSRFNIWLTPSSGMDEEQRQELPLPPYSDPPPSYEEATRDCPDTVT